MSEENFKGMGFTNYIFKEYDGMEHTNIEQVRTTLIYWIVSSNEDEDSVCLSWLANTLWKLLQGQILY